ncbi:DUF3993 domain-containing protein [Enterococcus faecium]
MWLLYLPSVDCDLFSETNIFHKKNGSIIYGTDESELILQPHFHFRY